MTRNFFDNPLLLILLVLIIVLVFGANRLPGAARSLGRSMRIFKSEVKEMRDDDRSSSSAGTGAPLEGRVVDPGQPTDTRATDAADGQRAQAQRAAEQRAHDTQRDA